MNQSAGINGVHNSANAPDYVHIMFYPSRWLTQFSSMFVNLHMVMGKQMVWKSYNLQETINKIHSFVHYKDLYSASLRGNNQKCSQPQYGRRTQIWAVELMFESGFREAIEEPRGDYSRLRNSESVVLLGGGAGTRNLNETLLCWANGASAQSYSTSLASLYQQQWSLVIKVMWEKCVCHKIQCLIYHHINDIPAIEQCS